MHIKEVTVVNRFTKANLTGGSTGITFNIDELKAMPNIIGDADPFLTIKSFGGVAQSGEGNSGLYVRGGDNDQNLILLNGTLIQNPTHVLGMFSVFNPDVVERIRFMKSGIPAEYGGRLASVVEVNTLSRPAENLKVDGAIGLISSRLAVQAPITEKLSAYGSLRASYLNRLVLPSLSYFGIDSSITQNQYEFTDANGGLVYAVNNKTKVSAHVYYGKDVINIKEIKKWNLLENKTQWYNRTASVQLNHVFNNDFSMNHHLGYSGFHITSDMMWGNSLFMFSSAFQNLTYKTDFFMIKEKHQVKYGAELAYDRSDPHFVKADSVSSVELNGEYNIFRSLKVCAFVRDEYTSDKLQVNIGIRATSYNQLGPYTDYISEGNSGFEKNEIVKSYFNFEPRFYARYLISNESSVKASASHHVQYLSQIPMVSVGIPFDLQIPASMYVKPQTSWHLSTGYFRNFDFNNYEASVETYYRSFNNQLEFTSGLIGTVTNKMLEKNLLFGKGYTYGAEFMFHKTTGKLTGWCSYNLAWSLRQFDGLNNGEPYFAKNDRRHDISVAGTYKLNERLSFSSMFVFATGSRINLPLSWFIIDDKVVLEFGDYNAFTLPSYHRLDVSAQYKLKPKKHYESSLTFSVYNLYNRANPFQVFYDTQSFYTSFNQYNFKMGMSYLLPIVPSVTWSFHFN